MVGLGQFHLARHMASQPGHPQGQQGRPASSASFPPPPSGAAAPMQPAGSAGRGILIDIPHPPRVNANVDPRLHMQGNYPVFCTQMISKVSSTKGRRDRLLVIVKGFVMQLAMSEISKRKRQVCRNAGLWCIDSVHHDPASGRVCVFFDSSSGKRDWEFFWKNHDYNTHRTPAEVLDVLDRARRPYCDGKPLTIRRGKINREPCLKHSQSSPRRSVKTEIQDDVSTIRSISRSPRRSVRGSPRSTPSVSFSPTVAVGGAAWGGGGGGGGNSVVSKGPPQPAAQPLSPVSISSPVGREGVAGVGGGGGAFGDDSDSSGSEEEPHGVRIPAALKLPPFRHYLHSAAVTPSVVGRRDSVGGVPESPERPISPTFRSSPERRARSPGPQDSWVNNLF